jgi:hypothetical protein
MRQPQARNCSSLIPAENCLKTKIESARPAGTPICGQLP